MKNREILFRGITESGELIYPDDKLFGGLKSYDILQRFEKVEQFTGLLDKNGVKIFEGDIIFRSGHEIKSVIEWVNKYMCFAGKITETTYGFYQEIDCPYIEVIGNIHDTQIK